MFVEGKSFIIKGRKLSLIIFYLNASSIFISLLLFVIVVVAGLVASQVQSSKNEPMFISRSEAFKFAVGDTITLPCEVTHPGKRK
jgi:hypothetical protein